MIALRLGDFNEILRHDVREADEPKEERCIRNFQKLMFDMDLVDCGFKGGAYNWRNNIIGQCLHKWSDRAYCSKQRKVMFLNMYMIL